MSPARAAPVAEAALDGPKRFVRLDRPGDDQVRDVRRVAASVEIARGGDLERSDRLRRPGRDPPIRRVRGVDLGEEPLVGEAARIGARLEDVVQALRLQAFELTLIEPRGPDHLREELEAVVELCPERGEPGTGAVPRRLAADLDPETLGRLREGRCIEALGAGHEQLGGQRRDSALLLVLARGAGVDQQVDADELAVGERDEPDGQPVREPLAGEVREPIRARCARWRSRDGHDADSAGT